MTSTERTKRYRLRHPDRARRIDKENKRRFRIKNPLQSLVRVVKQRARIRGFEFNIDASDLEIPAVCPVLRLINFTPSIDRIDNTKGYIKGNVRIISTKANRLKSDMTLEECKLLLKDFQNCRK